MTTRVCFVTLSRSDYASLRPVIRAAAQDPAIDETVVAGGSHLLKRLGNSVDDIAADGIRIDNAIAFMSEQDDSDLDIARAYQLAYAAFVDYLADKAFDCVFVLGDRWEMLAVASAASMLRVPIVHHSGGDITQGAQDNQTRYAISVLSHIHLVAIDAHRERLLALGEEPWRVITTGEPSLTELETRIAKIPDIKRSLGIEKNRKFVLATFHPTTYDDMPLGDQINLFLEALQRIEHDIILTAPNPDPGSKLFLEKLTQFALGKANIHLIENLGADRYYAAMSRAEFMIGNSSSGIWEAPSFALPVINIGERQKDRLRRDNVIDVPMNIQAITSALTEIEALKLRLSESPPCNPYVRENTLQLICGSIKNAPDRQRLLAKTFIDPLRKQAS